MYIYALVDPVTDDIRYVGKAADPDKRLRQHLKAARRPRSNKYLYNWMRSLDKEPWIWLLEPVDEDTWAEAEQYWIAALREDGEPLTNLTDGGEGGTGRRVGEEERALKSEITSKQWADPEIRVKMCEGMKGIPPWSKGLTGVRKHSEETRRKMSEAHSGENHRCWGKHLPEEARRKIAEANTGKKHSEETKRKLSEIQKGRKLTDEHKSNISEGLRRKAREDPAWGKKLSEVRKGEGNSFWGRTHSEESRQKMSEARKGQELSEAHKAKIAAGLKRAYAEGRR